MRASARTLLLAALVAACARDAGPPPPVQPIARIDLDSNRVVEVIGLRRWTAGMIVDSLKKYAPGEPIESEGTAANLRNLLGFADAATSIHSLVFDEDERATITLAVREPGDSARVHYAPQSLDSVPERADWKALTSVLVADTTGALLPAVVGAHLEGAAHTVVDSTVRGRTFTHREGYEYDSPVDSVAARPIIGRLATMKTPADLTTALDVIAHSNSGPDRAIASLVLANFPDRDESWRTLLKVAVGREQARDAFVAQHALAALADRTNRRVDWSPVNPLIHDVLDGTALAALGPLAGALASTGASPANAKAWLADGGEMLSAYVESDNPDVRDPAHVLLVKLRGTDLGLDPAPWREWIGTLHAAHGTE